MAGHGVGGDAGVRAGCLLTLLLLLVFHCRETEANFKSRERYTDSHTDSHKDNRNAESNFRQKEKQIIDSIIGPKNYDKRIRPAGANDTGPAVVYINIMIRNVQTISDVKMEYSIQITFREQWVDQRLTFDNMQGRLQYLTLTDTDMVWMPDLFFKNEKEGHFHKIILPNLYIRIFPDGGVLYSIRQGRRRTC